MNTAFVSFILVSGLNDPSQLFFFLVLFHTFKIYLHSTIGQCFEKFSLELQKEECFLKGF